MIAVFVGTATVNEVSTVNPQLTIIVVVSASIPMLSAITPDAALYADTISSMVAISAREV